MTVLLSGTPPLPALSPGQSANQTPQSSPDFRAKYKMHQGPSNLNNRPDLLENENLKKMQVGKCFCKNKFDTFEYVLKSTKLNQCYKTPVYSKLFTLNVKLYCVYQMKTKRWRSMS